MPSENYLKVESSNNMEDLGDSINRIPRRRLSGGKQQLEQYRAVRESLE